LLEGGGGPMSSPHYPPHPCVQPCYNVIHLTILFLYHVKSNLCATTVLWDLKKVAVLQRVGWKILVESEIQAGHCYFSLAVVWRWSVWQVWKLIISSRLFLQTTTDPSWPWAFLRPIKSQFFLAWPFNSANWHVTSSCIDTFTSTTETWKQMLSLLIKPSRTGFSFSQSFDVDWQPNMRQLTNY
jgi:hypothetical protein